MNVPRPGLPRADQFLVVVLGALVEGSHRRLENIVCLSGIDEAGDKVVRQGQRALVTTDGACTVSLRIFIFLILRVAEYGAAFTVPHFLIILIRHRPVICRAVLRSRRIMEAHSVHGLVELLVVSHLRHKVQGRILIGGYDLDSAVSRLCLLIHIGRELRLICHPVLKPLDKGRVRIPCLVGVRINVIDDIAILLVGVKNRLPVPCVHRLIAGALPVTVPFFLYPGGHRPPQEAHLHLRIDLLCVRGKLESGASRHISLLILKTHGTGIRPGRIIPVISHFHLHMVHQRMFPAEKHLQKLPVLLRGFLLIIHQKVTGAVSAEQAKALIRQAVPVRCRRVHILSLQENLRFLADVGKRHGSLRHREPGDYGSLSPCGILDVYRHGAVLAHLEADRALFLLHFRAGQHDPLRGRAVDLDLHGTAVLPPLQASHMHRILPGFQLKLPGNAVHLVIFSVHARLVFVRHIQAAGSLYMVRAFPSPGSFLCQKLVRRLIFQAASRQLLDSSVSL